MGRLIETLSHFRQGLYALCTMLYAGPDSDCFGTLGTSPWENEIFGNELLIQMFDRLLHTEFWSIFLINKTSFRKILNFTVIFLFLIIF